MWRDSRISEVMNATCLGAASSRNFTVILPSEVEMMNFDIPAALLRPLVDDGRLSAIWLGAERHAQRLSRHGDIMVGRRMWVHQSSFRGKHGNEKEGADNGIWFTRFATLIPKGFWIELG